jgi:hypothetical protein
MLGAAMWSKEWSTVMKALLEVYGSVEKLFRIDLSTLGQVVRNYHRCRLVVQPSQAGPQTLYVNTTT